MSFEFIRKLPTPEEIRRDYAVPERIARLKEERERALYAFEARGQAIGRIGLPAVREHRRKRLQQEHDARMAALDDMEASVPDLNAVMMVRVGGDA